MSILKSLRLEKKMTQADLAKVLKVSPSTIGMYEQGRREPDKKTLLSIADYFGVTTDYLLRVQDMNINTDNSNNVTLNGSNHGAISGSGTAMVINGSPISVEQAEYCLMCHSLSSGAREQINNMIKMLHELEHKK